MSSHKPQESNRKKKDEKKRLTSMVARRDKGGGAHRRPPVRSRWRSEALGSKSYWSQSWKTSKEPDLERNSIVADVGSFEPRRDRRRDTSDESYSLTGDGVRGSASLGSQSWSCSAGRKTRSDRSGRQILAQAEKTQRAAMGEYLAEI
ncbi:putative formin-like protein 5 [Iris pallida]|uniref:Formin-like protein 5 n=1 Tax=Iris pallida TaxID=29817 RepID=A0AAX6GNE5_IRIPA|nr:putative formin-like protein 5 [Iris pallida]